MLHFDTIIFDLGAVLIDWNPRYVYRKLFVTEYAMEHFLGTICTSQWNEQQDGGRSFVDATAILTSAHPQYQQEISAYYGRWKEMLAGPIQETVDILSELKNTGKYKLLALTNWSAESFPYALETYDFLQWFDGILVSGEEKMKKPDPAIFELLLSRYQVDREKAIFIDDNVHNVVASRNLGIETIHFKDPQGCREILNNLIKY
ncbi:MAG: HAD family phosphatase [Saprospiraceae bacterium]|nr:HAD family phosphatase [Saprospiraceae bacterium]